MMWILNLECRASSSVSSSELALFLKHSIYQIASVRLQNCTGPSGTLGIPHLDCPGRERFRSVGSAKGDSPTAQLKGRTKQEDQVLPSRFLRFLRLLGLGL